MWYQLGVKLAVGPKSQNFDIGAFQSAMAQPTPPPLPRPSVPNLNITPNVGSTAGAAAAAPQSAWSRFGQTVGQGAQRVGQGAKKMMPSVGKAVGPGLGFALGAPSAWKTRNPGGEVAVNGQGTPQEQQFLQRTQAGDQNAWQSLPQGYDINSQNGDKGIVSTVFGAVAPVATAASYAPGWLSSWNRFRQGDGREAIYNPAMLKHLLERKTVIDPSKGISQGKSPLERDLESAKAFGSGVNNLFKRPLQTLASGTGMIYDDIKQGLK